MATATRSSQSAVRERLVFAMAAVAALAPRALSELDWHRILDTVVLVTRD